MSEAAASLLAFTHGDRVAAEQLRRALAVIGEHHPEAEVARSARQVLDGRRTMREVTRDPAFLDALGRGMDAYAEEWAALSPAERAALAEQGKADTQRMAREIGLEDEDEPAEIGEFGPALTQLEPPA